ncbi:hypothetical protein MN116_004217 [Schistosoma mekongi]|uniref:Uncharacterized protein n=1 Tax=Schistosoma mekongi TaxID=38744 RepID=A0AAE1ZG14_SCHME|nr:hypothetical protein MN116_004217 [Schistosoma mekongi]
MDNALKFIVISLFFLLSTLNTCHSRYYTRKPIRCHVCTDCNDENQEIVGECGGCKTTIKDERMNKTCVSTCNIVRRNVGTYCCSKDKCNSLSVGHMMYLMNTGRGTYYHLQSYLDD